MIFVLLKDVTIVHQSPYQAGGQALGYNLVVLGVADGHNGCAAALHCQEKVYSELMQRMPAGPPPSAPGTQGAALWMHVLKAIFSTRGISNQPAQGDLPNLYQGYYQRTQENLMT